MAQPGTHTRRESSGCFDATKGAITSVCNTRNASRSRKKLVTLINKSLVNCFTSSGRSRKKARRSAFARPEY